jgi:hypothetical protein
MNARHFGTGTLPHLCKTFRHQDSSAPGQFGTCVFFFDFTYKTSNSLEPIPNLIVILMFCNRFFCILSFTNCVSDYIPLFHSNPTENPPFKTALLFMEFTPGMTFI